MPAQAIQFPESGGVDFSAAPTDVDRDFQNAVNHRAWKRGGISARPGWVAASAFRLWDRVQNPRRHRVMTFDGGDFFRVTGGRGFAIVDAYDGHIVGFTMVPVGGIPYPADADGNPNPPHEFIGDERLIFGCDGSFTDATGGSVTAGTAATAPVLRDGTDTFDSATYARFVIDDGAAVGNLAYRDVTYSIPADHDLLAFWLYWDGADGIIPAGQFQFCIATSTGLTGQSNALISTPLRPKRWTQVVIDLGDRGGYAYEGKSIGLRLAAALDSSLVPDGSLILRMESVVSGKRIRVNRLTSNDLFHFNTVNGKTLFGNERNAPTMWDGQDLMPATIPQPLLKPGISLVPTTDGSPSILAGPGVATGTDLVAAGAPASGEWEADPQANFTLTTKVTPTAPTVLYDGTGAFTDVDAQVDATNTNTNPTSSGGGNFLQVETTNYPTVGGVMCKADLNGATGYALQDVMEFEWYLDFGYAAATAPTKDIFRYNQISVAFYTGQNLAGTQVFEVPLNMLTGNFSAVSGAPFGAWLNAQGFNVTPQNADKQLRRWFTARVTGLSSLTAYGTVKSVALVFKSGGTSTATYDADAIKDAGTNKWRIRLDNIRTMGATYSGNAYHLAIDLIRNSGTAGTTTADAAIGVVAYKNLPTVSSIGANKAIQAKFMWECTALPQGALNAFPADLLRLQLYSSQDATTGALLTGDYGLIRVPLKPNEWTTATIALPPAGVATDVTDIESMALLITKKLDAGLYLYGATGNVARVNVTDIRILDAGQAATDLPTEFRGAFSWYDQTRNRESGVSPFSDQITCPIGAAFRLELTGWRSGINPYIYNQNPDPTRFQHVKLYIHSPLWGRNAQGLPRFVEYGIFPIPAGGQGSQYIALNNDANLALLQSKPAADFDLKLIFGPVPACRTAVTDGRRIFMAGQAGYSVGRVVTTFGSPLVSAFDAGGLETPEFDPYLVGHKLRVDHPSVKRFVFTIIGVVRVANAYQLVASDRFDDLNNEWNLKPPFITLANGVKYIIDGDNESAFWTSVSSNLGAHPDAVGPFNKVAMNFGAGDSVQVLHKPGDVVYAWGQTGMIPMRQNDTAIDDLPSSGTAYREAQKIPCGGVMAAPSVVSEAGGRTHWIGPEGVPMSGSLASAFSPNKLGLSALPYLSGEKGDVRIDTEGLRYAIGAYIEGPEWLMFIIPEARS